LLSQAIEVTGSERTLYISGQVGIGPDGNIGSGIAEQARFAIANLNSVLAAAGMNSSHIVKMTIFLTDEALMGEFVESAGPSLNNPPPATTLVFVKALAAPAMLVEIEAIAAA
jgi:enamine deaminase RidA (YjgF/YER057c/UK114 family)